jgi:hypothetical protein
MKAATVNLNIILALIFNKIYNSNFKSLFACMWTAKFLVNKHPHFPEDSITRSKQVGVLTTRRIKDVLSYLHLIQISSFFWKPKICQCVHQSSPMSSTWNRWDQFVTPYSISILILSSHVRLDIPSGFSPSGIPTKFYTYFFISHVVYMLVGRGWYFCRLQNYCFSPSKIKMKTLYIFSIV